MSEACCRAGPPAVQACVKCLILQAPLFIITRCYFVWPAEHYAASISGGLRGSTAFSDVLMRSRNRPVPRGHSAPMMMDSLTPTIASVRP